MSENNKVLSTIDTLFKGIESVIGTKTVVGEPVKAGEAIIIPLMDVSIGMGAGGFGESEKGKSSSGGGGMSAKLSPAAVLIIQNGSTKLVNVKNQDIMVKILDMIPELINRFKAKDDISKEVEELAKDMAKESEAK